MTALVLLHPEITPDPRAMRWVTDSPVPPDALERLLAEGVLDTVEVQPGHIVTRLAPGRSWGDDGPAVRSALFRALSGGGNDLTARVAATIAGEVAPYIESHGGSIEVADVTDGVLTVALRGACGRCTLRNRTLHSVVAAAVHRRFPQIREIRSTRAD